MRKVVLALLGVLLVVTITGCGGMAGGDPKNSGSSITGDGRLLK